MKEYHHGNLHQALIYSTLTLLKTKTPEEISLRQVARQAGVSQTAPYRHFEDKAALFSAVAQSILFEFDNYIEDSISQIDDSPDKRLRIISMAYIRYALKYPTKYQLLFRHEALEEPKLFSNQDSCLNDFPKTKILRLLVEIIETGQAKGQVKAGNAKTIALGLWSFSHGLTMLLLQGQLCLNDAEAVAFSSIMADSIAGIQV